MIPVKDNPGWVRGEAGALINSDTKAMEALRLKREAMAKKDRTVEELSARVESLSNEMSSINNKIDQLINLLQGK